MTRRGVLDKGMVWNSFSWWFEPYYLAVRRTPDLIADGRLKSKSPSLFQEIEWLSGIMQKVGKKEEQTNSYNSPNWEHVEAFLRDEAKLTEKIKLV